MHTHVGNNRYFEIMKNSNTLRVFVADDSTIVRAGVINMIAAIPGVDIIGYAEDGLQARDLILKSLPDVLVMDIRMPHKNGIEVLEEVKAVHPEIKVIMLTNYPYPQYRKRCMQAGADFFFEKAMEFNQVIEVLTGMTRNRTAATA